MERGRRLGNLSTPITAQKLQTALHAKAPIAQSVQSCSITTKTPNCLKNLTSASVERLRVVYDYGCLRVDTSRAMEVGLHEGSDDERRR